MNNFDRSAERNGRQKLQVLFVHHSADNYLYDLLDEIDFTNATLAEVLRKISGEKEYCDAVVVDGTIDSADVKALRKVTADADLPLIFYTSFFEIGVKDKALKGKADDYVCGSVRYTFATRVKLIKQLRKFKIQWLKQESQYKSKGFTLSARWPFFFRRILDITVSFVALILFSPAVLIIALAREMGSMKSHSFLNFKNKCLLSQMLSLYQFMVLIAFSPIFMIIRTPLNIKPKQRHLNLLGKSGSPQFDSVLIKTIETRASKLIGILRNDDSLFGAESHHVEKRIRGVREWRDAPWTGPSLSLEMKQ
jgi:hypothetical protein